MTFIYDLTRHVSHFNEHLGGFSNNIFHSWSILFDDNEENQIEIISFRVSKISQNRQRNLNKSNKFQKSKS